MDDVWHTQETRRREWRGTPYTDGDSVYTGEKLVWNFGDSRENVFDMYGDSRQNLFEVLAVVIKKQDDASWLKGLNISTLYLLNTLHFNS